MTSTKGTPVLNPKRSLYALLLRPRSTTDDGWRREFILNVLLAGSLVLVGMAFVIVLINYFRLGSDYIGEPPVLAFATVLIFVSMYALSRVGWYNLSAFMLVSVYFLLAFYALYAWGILLPQGVLILSLALVMSSILLGTASGALLTGVASVGLILLAYLQYHHILPFDSSWMKTPGHISDAIGYVVTLGVIAVVSWLSNREIERSLSRARDSEAQLKKERDLLEVKVKERTKELEQAQREKIMELSRFAEFGRLTSGIVHELVTPITTVALNLEQMHDEVHSERLRRAVESTKRLERYIEAARKQLQHQSETLEFALNDELAAAIEFLSPQAEKAGVQIDLIKLDNPKMYGNPIKFHQMVTNLIANAISAYEGKSGADKQRVTVELWRVHDTAQLTVKDWGAGIPPQYIDKIFDPFFTLKQKDQGIGIGLSLSRGIIENELGGTIEVSSDPQTGTIFTVRIPLTTKPAPASKSKHEKAA